VRRFLATLGARVAPPRFLLFLLLFLGVAGGLLQAGAMAGAPAILIGFDAGALAFLLSLVGLLGRHEAAAIRAHAERNDARRGVLLVVTFATLLVVLIAIGWLLEGAVDRQAKLLIVATMALAWLFSNSVYALHYAHLYYHPRHEGGLAFKGDLSPDYADFVYFAFTLGMTFQTSDVEITTRAMRRTVTLHSLGAFLFNLGVIAFTINVLSGD
jgi:uncharacterized membrane protein